MLKSAFIVFIVFVAAELLDLTGLVASAGDLAKFLFLVFVVLTALGLAMERRAGKESNSGPGDTPTTSS